MLAQGNNGSFFNGERTHNGPITNQTRLPLFHAAPSKYSLKNVIVNWLERFVKINKTTPEAYTLPINSRTTKTMLCLPFFSYSQPLFLLRHWQNSFLECYVRPQFPVSCHQIRLHTIRKLEGKIELQISLCKHYTVKTATVDVSYLKWFGNEHLPGLSKDWIHIVTNWVN